MYTLIHLYSVIIFFHSNYKKHLQNIICSSLQGSQLIALPLVHSASLTYFLLLRIINPLRLWNVPS